MAMHTFTTKLPDEQADKFKNWCLRRGTNPYNSLKDYIVDVLVNDDTVDFQWLLDVVMPYKHAARLAYDLGTATTSFQLPAWFTKYVVALSFKLNKTQYQIIDALQENQAFVRRMIISETLRSANEQDIKLTERPIAASDLTEKDLAVKRITITDEESEETFTRLVEGEE